MGRPVALQRACAGGRRGRTEAIAATSDEVYLGVDIGGTKLTVALVGADGLVQRQDRQLTEAWWQAAENLEQLDAMVAAALNAAEQPVGGLGIGFGGPVDFPSGRVMRSHHVEGWEGCPLRDHFVERFGLSCVVDNDANAGALGEARFGAGRGAACMLYVNIGTGIGGAVVIDHRVHRGAHSAAGEIGHCVVLPGGPECTCGKRGCLEAVCSGMSIGRRATEAAQRDPSGSAGWPREADGRVRAETVFEGASRGNPLAQELLDETVHYLALGLASPANVLDPDLIVLGGGVPAAGEILLGPLREAVRELATEALAPGLRLEGAQLGYDAGVIGAAALAMEADVSSTERTKGDVC